MSKPFKSPAWVPLGEAERILHRSRHTVRILVEQGMVRVHRPAPGMMATYSREDLERHAPPKS